MKTPAEVRTTAARRFRASCRRWLAGHLGLPDDSAWPFAVPRSFRARGPRRPAEDARLARRMERGGRIGPSQGGLRGAGLDGLRPSDRSRTCGVRVARSRCACSGRASHMETCARACLPPRRRRRRPEGGGRACLERARRMGGRGFRDSALRLQVACRQSRKRSLCSSAARRGHGYQVAHEVQNDGASRSSRRPLACFWEARARGAGLRGLRRSEEQALERAHEAS